MADQDDVRRLAMALPGVSAAAPPNFAFSVEVKGKDKGFAWVWQERKEPRKPRVPNPLVLAVRVANETEKAALLGADRDKFFTEPHYNGFPAVLVRLPAISSPELAHLLALAWRCQAPRPLVAAYDAGEAPPPPLAPASHTAHAPAHRQARLVAAQAHHRQARLVAPQAHHRQARLATQARYLSLALSSRASAFSGSVFIAWASAALASAGLPRAIRARVRPRWIRAGRRGGGLVSSRVS
jgi:hypothetical protein